MRPFTVQITCPYWNDAPRSFYEPKATSVHSRLEALKFLSEQGIDVELRIDPLFPSSRIEKNIRLHRPLSHYSLPEAQSEDDIANLVRFAKKSNVRAIIAKPLKVPISNRAERCKNWFGKVYMDANIRKKRTARGGSWRLPHAYQRALVSTVSDVCSQEGIPFRHCMHDVIARQ